MGQRNVGSWGLHFKHQCGATGPPVQSHFPCNAENDVVRRQLRLQRRQTAGVTGQRRTWREVEKVKRNSVSPNLRAKKKLCSSMA